MVEFVFWGFFFERNKLHSQVKWRVAWSKSVPICMHAQSYPTLCDSWTVATRLLSPWDSPNKNTGVGCHFLLWSKSIGITFLAELFFFFLKHYYRIKRQFWFQNYFNSQWPTIFHHLWNYGFFPQTSVNKESACNAGDPGLIPGLERSLEKKMVTYSSILAWRIPWIEEPGRLHTVCGVARVGQDLVTKPLL